MVPVAAPVPDPDLISTVFNNKNSVQNLAFSIRILEEALFPRKLASNFLFLTFVLHFMMDLAGSRTEPGSGTGMNYGSGSATAQSCGSCCSDSGSGATRLESDDATLYSGRYK